MKRTTNPSVSTLTSFIRRTSESLNGDSESDFDEVDGFEVEGFEIDEFEAEGIEVEGIEVEGFEADDSVVDGLEMGVKATGSILTFTASLLNSTGSSCRRAAADKGSIVSSSFLTAAYWCSFSISLASERETFGFFSTRRSLRQILRSSLLRIFFLGSQVA